MKWTHMRKTDVIIVGAGPAGLAAAGQLAAYELGVLIVDEQARAGGQIYRQPPRTFKVANWLSSRIYKDGKQLLNEVTNIEKIDWLTGTTVLGITQNPDTASSHSHKLTVCKPEGSEEILTRYVLIAPGCHDMSVVFPGWNLPGVMAAGGIQAFVKSQQLIPGQKFLFVGTHPLQLIIADQITQAGGEVLAVVFAQPWHRALALLKSPLTLIRHLNKFLFIAGTLLRLIKSGVPVYFSKTLVKASGKESLEQVNIVDIDTKGRIIKSSGQEFACDRLGICFSFLSSSELARQCEASHRWSAKAGGWIIGHDEWMRSDVSGIYVAGEITGVAGAEVAMEEGRLAGLGIAIDAGVLERGSALALSIPINRRLASLNKFADILKDLSYPGTALLSQIMTEDSTLCKCENISVREFKRQLSANPHISNSSAAKLLSRTGMGLCQGRYCHYHVTTLLSQHCSFTEQSVGAFKARFPAKPVTIKTLIK